MDIKQELIERSLDSPMTEICHFICEKDGEFYIVNGKNRSGRPREVFYIPAVDFLNVKNNHNLVALFHNHSKGSAAMSQWDKITSENSCYPLIVFSNTQKKFGFYVPQYCDADVNNVERLKEKLND